MPRLEGFCGPVKIFFIVHAIMENTKLAASKRSLLNIQNNFYFSDRKVKLVPGKLIVKINDEISCRRSCTLHLSIGIRI